MTVALACISSSAMGLPTMSLRPSTTAFAPSMAIPLRRRISITPRGVQATSCGAASHQPADVHGMKPVHIFCRVHGFEYALAIHLRRQRQLHENAVDVVAAIQFVDGSQHFRGGDGSGRREAPAAQSQLLAGRDLALDVDLRCGIFADEHRRQAGTNARGAQFGDLAPSSA